MKPFIKVIALTLLVSIFVFCLVSCKDEDDSIYGGDKIAVEYDPYDNVFKAPVDTGDPISVTGKTYTFYESSDPEDWSIEVRDSAGELSVTSGNALKKLYLNSSFTFTAENKVMFEEGNVPEGFFFSMLETEGVRDGNVLTVKHTNNSGVAFDVRFEIHKDRIYVIHNGHHYNTEGTYVTLVFRAQ